MAVTSGRQAAIRASSFVRREWADLARQPVLVLTLVAGPFVILLLFGAGLKDDDPTIRAVIVASAGTRLAALAEQFAEAETSRALVVERVEAGAHEPLQQLRAGDLEVVVVLPDDAVDTIRRGEQAEVIFYHNFLDPLEVHAMELQTRQAIQTLNDQVSLLLVRQGQAALAETRERLASARRRAAAFRAALQRGDLQRAQRELALLEQDVTALGLVVVAATVVERSLGPLDEPGRDDDPRRSLTSVQDRIRSLDAEGLARASTAEAQALEAEVGRLAAGLDELLALTPRVLVSPFAGTARRVTGGTVKLTDYYAPAVVVLLAQHLVITFLGLSVVREDQLGTTELFRAAPLTALEVLVGKSLAYLLMGAAGAATLTALLILGLDVPMRGSWWLVAASIVALLAAATALGFVLALLARSDSQAVQYAMIILLASIFLSGFLLTLERFRSPVDAVARLLPATYGIQLLRSSMLQSNVAVAEPMGTLVGMAAVLFAIAWLLLRRRLRRG